MTTTHFDLPHLHLGVCVAPACTATIPVRNPAIQQVPGHVPAGAAEDVDRAVAAIQIDGEGPR